MSCILKFIGVSDGSEHWISGTYLKSWDPSAPADGSPYDGGILDTADDPHEALAFASAADAMSFWRTHAPAPFHIRPDGQPNRPLTAFTIEICPAPDKRAVCPKCNIACEVTVEPDEKPDGTILGYAFAKCEYCGHELTEDEIYEGKP